jgi:hypothetical protein
VETGRVGLGEAQFLEEVEAPGHDRVGAEGDPHADLPRVGKVHDRVEERDVRVGAPDDRGAGGGDLVEVAAGERHAVDDDEVAVEASERLPAWNSPRASSSTPSARWRTNGSLPPAAAHSAPGGSPPQMLPSFGECVWR